MHPFCRVQVIRSREKNKEPSNNDDDNDDDNKEVENALEVTSTPPHAETSLDLVLPVEPVSRDKSLQQTDAQHDSMMHANRNEQTAADKTEQRGDNVDAWCAWADAQVASNNGASDINHDDAQHNSPMHANRKEQTVADNTEQGGDNVEADDAKAASNDGAHDINSTDGLAENPQAIPASSNAVPPFQTLDDPEWAAVTLISHLERLQEASNNVDIENLSDFMTDLQLVHNTETCSSYVLSGSMCQCKFAM